MYDKFKEDIDRATETADEAEWMTCGRVWEAWNVGTMTQDDFQLVSEDEGSLGDLVDLIKQSYLNAIDVMIDSYEKYFNQSIIESPQFEHLNYLQEQRKLIQQHE